MAGFAALRAGNWNGADPVGFNQDSRPRICTTWVTRSQLVARPQETDRKDGRGTSKGVGSNAETTEVAKKKGTGPLAVRDLVVSADEPPNPKTQRTRMTTQTWWKDWRT